MPDVDLSDIQPINQVQKSLANLIARSEHTGRPVIITQRGLATAILIAADLWQDVQDELARLRQLVEEGAHV